MRLWPGPPLLTQKLHCLTTRTYYPPFGFPSHNHSSQRHLLFSLSFLPSLSASHSSTLLFSPRRSHTFSFSSAHLDFGEGGVQVTIASCAQVRTTSSELLLRPDTFSSTSSTCLRSWSGTNPRFPCANNEDVQKSTALNPVSNRLSATAIATWHHSRRLELPTISEN